MYQKPMLERFGTLRDLTQFLDGPVFDLTNLVFAGHRQCRRRRGCSALASTS